VVARFIDTGGPEPNEYDPEPPTISGHYSATIDWGDGTPDDPDATITYNEATGYFEVTGSAPHTYAEEGTYTVHVTVYHETAPPLDICTTVYVTDAPLTGQGKVVVGTEGQAIAGLIPVATFTDTGGAEPIADYSASINWGDNSETDAGTIVSLGNGQFEVDGPTHLYGEEGTYHIMVMVYHESALPICISSTALIAEAPLEPVIPPLFQPPVQYAAGETPDSLASLTLDDGTKLLLVANFNGDSVTVLQDNGDGTFTHLTDLATGAGPNGFAVGNFGNGHQDFAIANFYSNTVSVFLGDGTGNFTQVQTLYTGNNPANEMALADLNEDCNLDLITANQGDGTVSIFFGNGNGTFRSAVTYLAGAGADAVVTGNFGGNGFQDIATANFAAGTVSILYNDGTGHFSAPQTIAVGSGPFYLIAGQFTGPNGPVDLATANYYDSTVSVLLNNGDGTFSRTDYAVGSGPDALALGDFNGHLDIVSSNYGSDNVTILYNDGTGNFTSSVDVDAGAGVGPNGIVVGDFDGNGSPDIATANQNTNDVSVLLNNTPYAVEGLPTDPIVAQFIDTGGPEPNQYDPNPPTISGHYHATIDWGDGSALDDDADITYNAVTGNFEVSGSEPHTYAEEGAYTVTVTICHETAPPITIYTAIIVTDAPLTAAPESLCAVEGVPLHDQLVATFTDANPIQPQDEFTASVMWGDGSTIDNNTFITYSDGVYYVYAVQHTYANVGDYMATVTIVDEGGSTATAWDDIMVAPWTLTAYTRGLDPYEGYLTPIGEAQVDVNYGALLLNQSVNISQSDSGRAWYSPTLIYNSYTVTSQNPIIEATLATSCYVPTSIVATLSIDGVAQAPVTFSTAGHQVGDTYLLAVQSTAELSTGIHDWTIDVQATLPNGQVIDRSSSGQVGVVSRVNSPFGAGWWMSDLDQLVQDPTTHDVLWISGNGWSRIFEANPTSAGDTTRTFMNPSGDFGTLTQDIATGVFTYTTPQQVVWTFNPAQATGGLFLLATQVDPHGLTESWTYNSQDQLTQIQNIDGAQTSFSYGSTTTITELSNTSDPRTITLNINGSNDLTSLTDEDGNPRTFAYGAALPHLLTQDAWTPWDSSFSYDSQSGRLISADLGLGSVYKIEPAALQGIVGSGPANNASQADGTVTVDPSGLDLTTTYQLDENARLTMLTRPDGTFETFERNDQGQVTAYTDFLGITTDYEYDDSTAGAGDLIEVDYADGTDETYQYNLTFHEVTESTDRLGLVTTYTIDPSNGDVLSMTDPMDRTTQYVYSDGLVTEIIDPLDQTTTYSYNGDRQDVAIIDPLGGTTDMSYDAAGYATSITDPAERTTENMYDNRGLLTESTDPAGRTTNTDYDAYGDVTETVDGLRNATYMTYDTTGSLTETVDPLGITTFSFHDTDLRVTETIDGRGNPTLYSYDKVDNQTETIDPNGNKTFMQYDADGDVTETIDGRGNPSFMSYDVNRRETLSVDPLGRATTTMYDADGDVTETIDPLGRVTTTVYDDDQEVTETIDPMGRATTTLYDADGEVTDSIDPLGRSTTTMYDADGEVTDTIDPMGRATTTLYDADGEVTDTIDPASRPSTELYDGDGEVTDTIDPASRPSTELYDGDGEVTLSIDPLGRRTTTLYDADGNVTETIDPMGRATTTNYDADNRATETIDPMGRATTTAYDNDGDVTLSIDPLGRATTTMYDPDGNITETVDPLGRATTTAYDADSEATLTIDPMGRATTTTYDADGEVTLTQDPLGRATTTQYDADGEVTDTIDPMGRATTTMYDADGEVTDTVDPLGRSTTTLYDADGEVTDSIDPMGRSTTTKYDADGEVTDSLDPLGRQTTTLFDADGEVTETIDALGRATTTMYDADGEVTESVDPMGRATTTMYDADGEVTESVDPMGRATTTMFDADGEVTETVDPLGRATTTMFDADGEVTESIDPLGRTTTTMYDADGEVTDTIDPMGRATTTMFDADGEVTETVDPMGRATTTMYDADGEAQGLDSLGYRCKQFL